MAGDGGAQPATQLCQRIMDALATTIGICRYQQHCTVRMCLAPLAAEVRKLPLHELAQQSPSAALMLVLVALEQPRQQPFITQRRKAARKGGW